MRACKKLKKILEKSFDIAKYYYSMKYQQYNQNKPATPIGWRRG